MLSSDFFNQLVRSHWLSFYLHRSRQIHVFLQNKADVTELLQMVEQAGGLIAEKKRHNSQYLHVKIREAQ